MYPVENGIYHVRRSGMSVAMEYLRISEQECVELYKASEDKLYFRYMLFNLGNVDRWKRESEELIAELEKLCGKKWVNPYKPEEILRSFDFTVAKMAYYKEPKYEEKEDDYFPFSSASIVGYEYKLLYHEKFFEHLHMKRLVIDENIPFPVSTWECSYRYKGYGYNMCRETKKKLLQALKGVNVEEEDVSLYTTGGWD